MLLACSAVMFHSINGGIIKLRGEKDDMFNDIAAAVATGSFFRSTCELVCFCSEREREREREEGGWMDG